MASLCYMHTILRNLKVDVQMLHEFAVVVYQPTTKTQWPTPMSTDLTHVSVGPLGVTRSRLAQLDSWLCPVSCVLLVGPASQPGRWTHARSLKT